MNSASRALPVIALAGLIAFLASSCGGNRILIEPPANSVHKLALVSVNAQRGVRNLEGGGGSMQKLSALASLTKKSSSSSSTSSDFGGTALVDVALSGFESEMAQVPGWQVVPAREVIKTPAYTKFESDSKQVLGGMFSSLSNLTNFGPDGMVVLPQAGKMDYSGSLAELARNLDVDAVAVINMDVAYKPSTAIMGTGTAAASVGMGIILVTRDGKYAIKVLPDTNQYRVTSDETAAMVGGNLIWTDAASVAFKQSVNGGLAKIRGDIVYDLTKKK